MKKMTGSISCLFGLFVGVFAAWAGPEQNFDAAMKAGKPLSAEAAYREWVKAGGDRVPSMRHVQAAEVAEQIGKNAQRNDRLRLYVRLEKNWNPTVERICWRLASETADVDIYARLSANTPANDALWITGRGIMERLADQRRAVELIRVADILLAKFKEKPQIEYVLRKIYENSRNGGEGYPYRALVDLVMRHPGLGDTSALNDLLGWGDQRKAFSLYFPLAYWAKHGGEMRDATLARAIEYTNNEYSREEKDPEKLKARNEKREEAVRLAKKLESQILDGKHPESAYQFLYFVGNYFTAQYDPMWKKDDKTPVTSAATISAIRKIMNSERFKTNAGYRNGVLDRYRQIGYWKRLSEADKKALDASFEKFPHQSAAQEDLLKQIRETKDKDDKNYVQREALARKLLQIVDKNFVNWYQIEWVCDKVKKNDLTVAYRMKRAQLTDDVEQYFHCLPEKGATKPIDGIDMKKMTAWQAREYCWVRLFDRLKDDKARQPVMNEYFVSHSLLDVDPNMMEQQLQWCNRMASCDPAYLKTIPLDALMKDAFQSPVRPRGYDLAPRLWVARLAVLAGRTNDVLTAYRNWAKKLDCIDRIAVLRELRNARLLRWTKGKDGKMRDEWPPMFEEKVREEILLKDIREAYAAVPDIQTGRSDFSSGDDMNSINWLYNWAHEKETKEKPFTDARKARMAEVAKDCEAWYDLVPQRVLAMARHSEGWGYECRAWNKCLRQALDAKDPVAIARYARRAAVCGNWNWIGYDTVVKFMDDLKASGNDESFYLYVDGLPSDTHGDLLAIAVKHRAALASKLPGIYPVSESDPAYPLYVAADELKRKNPEHAWQILREPRNQTVFEQQALKLPPEFVIWGVEQLRMARGEKDKLLVKARQIATAIIAQESKVAPEMTAAMILSRAEGYRDQQNFEAAKLEYQSIRDNPTYHKTSYGKKAMFRAVDLQIVSGNSQAVEATLEYWLSQPDREVQAEAHYFQAKIAFDRKDYDECIKQLRQVFAINFTHTEGRFLQGKWKLATNSEVDDTDVLIGDLSERNMIRPGNQLTVTVQDANLSVAGGGASIPVIVTAEPGGDKERINLYPTSRDPSNFKGLVEVRLGKAVPSNLCLEVRGDDTVSYEIDPAFLKERGLPKNEPRRLKVIDDAKLAIGAGAPRTDEKKTEKGVKNLLQDSDNLEDSGVVKKLRPGNPLYVVVQDRDCSLGGSNDAVRVTVETSSGDRLQNFVLGEEKPFSGVFRGKVTTSLPPPRAFAKDSAAGMNPGDVINSSKSAGWKSLADGQPGKWFAVDTMNSHLFSEIAFDTPSMGDVKTLKLIGRMGSKVMTLAQLPAASETSKLYLRRQQQYDRNTRASIGNLRAFCQTDRAAKTYIVEEIKFRVLHKGANYDRQSAYYQGPFVVPEGTGSLRLRIKPVSTGKLALKDLWVAFALDGEEVFSGQGCKLQDALVSADVAPGCHRFELAVIAGRRDDEFDLLWEPEGKEPRPLPKDWFSEEKNPVLKTFVKDLATIIPTSTGCKAVFDKPVRLRSFRLEFADIKSPDVSLTRITAKNDKGETILPVASDFSDSQQNDLLEVAPGDKITVKYQDERTTAGEKKVLQRDIDSSFNDAVVRFVFEETDANNYVRAYDAFRFLPGDTLVLSVADPDCDVTDEADKISVSIKNSAGQTFTKKLTEYLPPWARHSAELEAYGMHSGIFMGVIKTCAESNTNAPKNVLRVASDDLLTVTYEDRENTDPGVPFARQTRIFASRPATPALTLFNVKKTREIDKSPDAKVRLDRIRRRPGNENVQVVYRDVLTAEPIDPKTLADNAPVPVNVAAGCIPLRVTDRSRARYECSKIYVEAVAESEIAKAQAEGRDPDKVKIALKLGDSLSPFRLRRGDMSKKEAQSAGVFNGVLQLSLGPIDPNIEVPEDAPPLLCVTGSDTITLTVLDENGAPAMTRKLKLVSDAFVSLTDSSLSAERDSAHVGESFFVVVEDADRDATEEPDHVSVTVRSTKTGVTRPMTLTETMPHSGIFSGRLRPVMFAPGETIPSVSTGGVASANEILTEERFSIGYGDKVAFAYKDELTLPGTPAGTICATGSVFRGSNGDVRLFSKRFSDRDAAVLVQFRLAECLFEQAKEHRKLKQHEKSSKCIDEGKFILEEALKNYPDSSHVAQGEFLLANLYQELANEAKEANDLEKATPLYQEALSRFSQILGTWPEGEYAARSQYHKALCLEMLKDYNRASEEYVKMTYLYPESELVGEATIRLATYYYTQEKRYDISGHIYRNFQQRFPQHEKAARALFMAGSCYIKQAETMLEDVEKRKAAKQPLPPDYQHKVDIYYRDACATFEKLIDQYKEGAAKLRAQTLYWAGDVCVRRRDYTGAYRHLKQCVFEYPETEWARRARGLLLQEENAFREFE